MKKIAILLICVMFFAGCSTWRGIPSHGGGKRFDEEQRVVASSIRQAIADMNVSELTGMKINVVIDAMAQNGGGQLSLPGLDNISAGYSNTETDGTTNNIYSRKGWDARGSISTQTDFRPTVFATDGDLKYLESALNMKLLHSGIMFAAKNPDAVLYVLVDVLGTNRSRNDSFICWKDNLRATCELTYYAIEPKSSGMYFAARRASAESTYFEKSILLFNNYASGRSLNTITPTYMPVDGNYVKTPVKIVSTAEPGPVVEPNKPEKTKDTASQFVKMRKRLEQKLVEANSYIQAGNLTAAEKTVNDIRSVDPEYPGLNSVYSRLEAAKNQDPNSK
ncbi:MAG: hypothetical protein LLF92_05110 [Planctomycetaceae bacterium]|nr:hypothetical protein [Planctomycetaceae bacterium]